MGASRPTLSGMVYAVGGPGFQGANLSQTDLTDDVEDFRLVTAQTPAVLILSI
jgi:hypothetical protein